MKREQPKQKNDYTALLQPVGTKQETLEELKKWKEEALIAHEINQKVIEKLMAEKKLMYSEEDVRGMLEDMSRYVSTKEMRDNVVDVGYSEWVRKRDWFVNHLIKQFKNK